MKRIKGHKGEIYYQKFLDNFKNTQQHRKENLSFDWARTWGHEWEKIFMLKSIKLEK